MVLEKRCAPGEECSRRIVRVAEPGAHLETQPGLAAGGQELAFGDGRPLADPPPRHQQECLGVDRQLAVDLALRRGLDGEVAVVRRPGRPGRRPAGATSNRARFLPAVSCTTMARPRVCRRGKTKPCRMSEAWPRSIGQATPSAMAMSRPWTVSSLSMWQVRTDAASLCPHHPAVGAVAGRGRGLHGGEEAGDAGVDAVGQLAQRAPALAGHHDLGQGGQAGDVVDHVASALAHGGDRVHAMGDVSRQLGDVPLPQRRRLGLARRTAAGR